jgi:hypothetical protein
MAEPIVRLEQLLRSSRAREQRFPFLFQSRELRAVRDQGKREFVRRLPRTMLAVRGAAPVARGQPARVEAIRDGHGAVRGAGRDAVDSGAELCTAGAKALFTPVR